MGKVANYLSTCAWVSLFVALLQVSAIGQSLGRGLAAEKVRKDMAALNDKALAGDTQAQLHSGLRMNLVRAWTGTSTKLCIGITLPQTEPIP